MARYNQVGMHKTSIFTDAEGALCCKYHNTIVAKKLPDGKVVLNSGGFRSNTTKLRMNQFAQEHCAGRFGVSQKNFDWFVGDAPFSDNMVV